ncbi:hypothetical protein H109_07989 [Trichophyton interdigitale MR816]|nr:hypothetical protein H101_03207 [Trichophyton interdigitale H6]KDB20048.1 hypothetical protein H109_07989 [Trichophyton interdigitale MR816]
MHAYISKASSLDTLTPGMEIVTSSHLDIGEGPTTLIMPVRFPSLSARMWYLAERQPLLEAIDPLSSPASLSILYIQWDGQPGASRLLRFPIRRQYVISPSYSCYGCAQVPCVRIRSQSRRGTREVLG